MGAVGHPAIVNAEVPRRMPGREKGRAISNSLVSWPPSPTFLSRRGLDYELVQLLDALSSRPSEQNGTHSLLRGRKRMYASLMVWWVRADG